MKTKRFIFIAATSVLMAVLVLGAAAPAARAADGCNAPNFICEHNYGHFPVEACNQMAQANMGTSTYLGCWSNGYANMCVNMNSNNNGFWGCWDTGDGQAYLYHQ